MRKIWIIPTVIAVIIAIGLVVLSNFVDDMQPFMMGSGFLNMINISTFYLIDRRMQRKEEEDKDNNDRK